MLNRNRFQRLRRRRNEPSGVGWPRVRSSRRQEALAVPEREFENEPAKERYGRTYEGGARLCPPDQPQRAGNSWLLRLGLRPQPRSVPWADAATVGGSTLPTSAQGGSISFVRAKSHSRLRGESARAPVTQQRTVSVASGCVGGEMSRLASACPAPLATVVAGASFCISGSPIPQPCQAVRGRAS